MSPSTIVALNGLLTCGVPMALAVWEICSLRRGGPPSDDRPSPPRLPQPKPLPDCLLPRPVVRRRERVLEDA